MVATDPRLIEIHLLFVELSKFDDFRSLCFIKTARNYS